MPDTVVAAVIARLGQEAGKTTSPEKLDALITATARQFDSSIDEHAIRSYWLNQVAELSDVEVLIVREMIMPAVPFDRVRQAMYRVAPAEVELFVNELKPRGEAIMGGTQEAAIPVGLAVGSLKQSGLIFSRSPSDLQTLEFTKPGECLAKLITPIEL
ncbi:MAG: hypothetical protein AAF605_03995 [Myxococcota bacterium]